MQENPTRWRVRASVRLQQINRTKLMLTAGITVLVLLSACSMPWADRAPTEAEPTVELSAYEPGSIERASADTTAEATNGADAADAPAAATAPPDEPAPTNTADNIQAPDTATSANPALPDTNTTMLRGSYNGEIEAVDSLAVVAEVNGRVLDVAVDVGDRVRAGDPIVHIDGTTLEAQYAQAQAALNAAQAQLDQMLAPPDEDDVAAAQAALNAAGATYQETVDGPRTEDLRIAESQVRQAEAAVSVAQSAYNDVKWNPKIAMLPQTRQLEQATQQLESALAQYDKVANGATDDQIAGAFAQLESARAQLAALEEGAEPEQIRAMEAQVEQAEMALYLAALQLDKTTVRAPMDGIVASVDVSAGTMAAPGSPLLRLISEAVKVTIPVEEFRLPELRVGQSASIRVNAYPDQAFSGEVTNIAPQLDPTTRTVAVTVRPSGNDATLLAPGMFATVDLLTAEASTN